MGVGHQHRVRGVIETPQVKDREGGVTVSLDDHKEGHHNSSYWDQVDQDGDVVPVQQQQPMNRGTENNVITNKHSALKRKMWHPITGTHTVAGVSGTPNRNIGGLIRWWDVA